MLVRPGLIVNVPVGAAAVPPQVHVVPAGGGPESAPAADDQPVATNETAATTMTPILRYPMTQLLRSKPGPHLWRPQEERLREILIKVKSQDGGPQKGWAQLACSGLVTRERRRSGAPRPEAPSGSARLRTPREYRNPAPE